MTGIAGLCVAVAAGSAIGGVLRALVSIALAGVLPGIPLATLAVNVTGSFAIGLYAAWIGQAVWSAATARRHHFVMTGLCGGYTTFSMFSLETLHLAQAGDLAGAAANVAVSVVAWLAAAWLGWRLGTRRRPA